MELEVLKEFFLWSTVIAAGLYIWTVVWCIFGVDFAYKIHSKLFDVPRESFGLILYCFLGFFKISIIVLFLVPYLALVVMT